MKAKQDVTMRVTLPGYTHYFPLTGQPAVRETYLRSGHPAVDIVLGDHIDGTAPGSVPELTVESIAELDALEAAVRRAREQLAQWFAPREAVA